MKCPVCKNGATVEKPVTVTLNRDESTVVFKRVPARVCDNCSEEYVDEDVSASLMQLAEAAVAAGVEVEVREYVPA